MQAEIEVVVGIEPDRVAAGVSVGVIDVGDADRCGVEGEENGVAAGLDALRFGQDNRGAGDVGTVGEEVAYVLKGVFAVGEIGGNAAACGVDCGDLPAAEGFLHEEGSCAAEHAAFAIGQIVDDGQDIVKGLVVGGRTTVAERVRQVDAPAVASRCIKPA